MELPAVAVQAVVWAAAARSVVQVAAARAVVRAVAQGVELRGRPAPLQELRAP
jgi:hypothetical protein